MNENASEREIVPDAFRVTAQRLATGSIVLRQTSDNGEAIVIVPAQFVQAFCQGVYDVSMERA